MIDPTRLRALLSDHAPRAYYDREQRVILEVWEALPELLRVYEAWAAAKVHTVTRSGVTYGHGHCGTALRITLADDYYGAMDESLAGARVRVVPERESR